MEKCRALDACTQQLQDSQTTVASLDTDKTHLQQEVTRIHEEITRLQKQDAEQVARLLAEEEQLRVIGVEREALSATVATATGR